MSSKWKVFWVASFALVVFFQACGLHSWEELMVSTSDEKKMGREFDSLVRDKNKQVVNSGEELFTPSTPEQEELYAFYLERGKEIVNAIDPKDLQALLPSEKLCRNNNGKNRNERVTCTKENFFEFKIIKSNQLNAFAVPGGYVYFYTRILKSSGSGFQSESELMSVLGHEVGHVVLHHSRDAIVKQVGASTIIELLLGEGMGATLASLGASFWLLQNSQENEADADVKGFEYTDRIKISSKGLSDFFSRGLKKNADGTYDCKDNSSLSDVFSTHPPSCERVQKNDERIRNANQTEETHPMNKHTSSSGKYFTQLVKDAGI